MKKLTPTAVSNDSVTIDIDLLTDLVQRVDRCADRLAELEGNVLWLERQQAAHGEAHGLAMGAPVSLGTMAATHPVVITTAPQAAPVEVEVLPDGKASALLVKISYREGCTVESVRAMLSGKRERIRRKDGTSYLGPPRGDQFLSLRDASGEAGIPLTQNVHILRQLVQPYRAFPTRYGAIKSGKKVRIT